MLTEELENIQEGDLFTVSSWRSTWSGIAVEWQRYDVEEFDASKAWWLLCEDDSCDHASDICWMFDRDYEPQINEAISVVIMVGDDRERYVETADLIPVRSEQVCSCGQIGCWSAEEQI
jgi:hypothetical protein